MIDSSNKISGSGAPQQPDPAGFRAFTDRIMQLMTGLKGTLFPEGDKTLATPDQLLLGNPAKPDKEKAGEAISGGSMSVRTESSIDDKLELLKNLMENADSDDVESIDPRLSDLNDDAVVRLIEEAKYDEALGLIEDNRAAEAEEAKDDGKEAGDKANVSKANAAGDADAEDKAPGISDDKADDAAEEPSDEG